MIDGAANPVHPHAPCAPAVLAAIRPDPRPVRPAANACLDEVILSDACRTKALFDCPPEPIPFATYLEELNRAKRIGDAAELAVTRDPGASPPDRPRPDAPAPNAEPRAVGSNPSPKLGDPAPAAAPPTPERPAPAVAPPPVRSPAGRILDLFA